jgi:peptide/nickel transport system substrate-binding protein
VSSNGDEAWFGWPTSPQVEAEVAAWFDATFDEEKTIARRLNKAALDQVIYAPVGCGRPRRLNTAAFCKAT